MRAYYSAPTSLFASRAAAQANKRPYSPWAPLVFCFTFAMVFVGLVAAFQFLWPALNSTFIRVSALVVFVGLAFVARKVGLLPIPAHADADQLPRGICFLSWFLGLAVVWLTVSAVFESRVTLDNVIGAVLFGLMWAGLDDSAR